eukprot:11608938-Karenia_brevis.AAC.1
MNQVLLDSLKSESKYKAVPVDVVSPGSAPAVVKQYGIVWAQTGDVENVLTYNLRHGRPKSTGLLKGIANYLKIEVEKNPATNKLDLEAHDDDNDDADGDDADDHDGNDDDGAGDGDGNEEGHDDHEDDCG